MSTKCGVVSWLIEPVESIVLQVPRALVASGLAAALDFGVLVGLVEGAAWHPLTAATISYLLGGIVQYVLCSLWVFPNAPRNATTSFMAFTVLSLFGLAITWVVMALMHDWLTINYAAAKVTALGLAFAWNFLSRKYLLFRSAASASGCSST